MFVDMPPGTGDVPLTVFQSLPVDGIMLVTSPQELVGMIVKKAVNMAEMMNVPVLGLVENMSGFQCDQCGKVHDIFGASHVEDSRQGYGHPRLRAPAHQPQAGRRLRRRKHRRCSTATGWTSWRARSPRCDPSRTEETHEVLKNPAAQ